MFKKDNTTINTNVLKRNWATDKSSYNLDDSGFAIGIIGENDISSEQFVFDPTYLWIDFQFISYNGTPLHQDPSMFTFNTINLTLCNDTFAKLYGQNVSDTFNLHSFICPENLNFDLQGNGLSSTYKYFQLTIKK